VRGVKVHAPGLETILRPLKGEEREKKQTSNLAVHGHERGHYRGGYERKGRKKGERRRSWVKGGTFSEHVFNEMQRRFHENNLVKQTFGMRKM